MSRFTFLDRDRNQITVEKLSNIDAVNVSTSYLVWNAGHIKTLFGQNAAIFDNDQKIYFSLKKKCLRGETSEAK